MNVDRPLRYSRAVLQRSGASSLSTFIRLLPVGRKLLLIVALFVVIVVCLLVLSSAQMDILSGVRAYVAGEGEYSKGQKDAVQHLVLYANSRDERDYQRFLAAIDVPLGDQQARIELGKAHPDMDVVREGFVRGKNHPNDVPSMARLFRRFRNVDFMSKAIAIWTAGDRYITQINRLGEELHDELARGAPDSRRVAAIVDDVRWLNARLTPLETAFSRTLAKGARTTKDSLQRLTYATTTLLLIIGVLLSWRLASSIQGWETRYRHLLDAANDGIVVANLETGVILDANRRAAELIGQPVTRLVGMHQADLHPPGERERWHALLAEQRRTGQATTADLHLRHADGHDLPVEVSAAVTQLAGHAVVQSLYRDVTERRRAEEDLRESEERYRNLFENAIDLVYTHDLRGNLTSINEAAERLSGYSRAEACSMNIADIVAPDHLELAQQMIRHKRGDEQLTTVYELDVVTKDGRRVPLEVSTRLMMRDGEAVGVQGIARDITYRKRAERERAELLGREQAARAEAEHASRAKDEFLSVLSHELRTPLTPILAWARMLQREALAPEVTTRGLQAIERGARSQAQLVDDLLDVSRIISGKLRLEVRPVQLVGVIEAAAESVRVAAEAKGITLELDLDARAGLVAGDPERLQQVVWNLLSNAVKFTPEGGHVRTTLARSDGHLVVSVRDDGKGISTEFLPFLFERFRQADSSSTRAHGGLGLGLAIVRHLLELHGGSVWAESAGEGQGAVFTVSLPAIASVSEDVAPLDVQEALEPPSLDGLRVLVVDDDQDTRELVSALLDTSGARVRTAASVAEALQIFERWPPDVLVSDLGMPEQDGYALIREVRARERGSGRLPAVALTAYAREEERTKAREAGFQVHVAKPFDPPELLSVIADLARPLLTARRGTAG